MMFFSSRIHQNRGAHTESTADVQSMKDTIQDLELKLDLKEKELQRANKKIERLKNVCL